MPNRQGSIRLFRFLGVEVFLHWSWFLVAIYEIERRSGKYSSIAWNVLEYLALFAIVLTHEYGHALACRQVGGTANRIVLWPLGGVAYVDPPQRPGATLWSIAAGPLVNVALFPVLFAFTVLAGWAKWQQSRPDLNTFLFAVLIIDVALLIFNILPIYPLDGGQILRSLLWFVIGRARSLTVATLLGFVGVAGLLLFAVRSGSVWLGIMAIFLVLNCWAGLKHSLHLWRLGKLPHRSGFVCASCRAEPPQGRFWTCAGCETAFDAFESRGVCSNCGAVGAEIPCIECGRRNSIDKWVVPEKAVAISS
jgi:Zn-dependent protease